MSSHALPRTLLASLIALLATTATAVEPDPERLRRDVEYLAHDDRQGRGVGTRGLEEAAEYIAERFEALGLEPGVDESSWFQEFEATTGLEIVGTNSLTLSNTVVWFCPSANTACARPALQS